MTNFEKNELLNAVNMVNRFHRSITEYHKEVAKDEYKLYQVSALFNFLLNVEITDATTLVQVLNVLDQVSQITNIKFNMTELF